MKSNFYLQTHDDYRGLERAKEAMVDVAQYTNEVKRDSEHLVVIQKVKVRIVNLSGHLLTKPWMVEVIFQVSDRKPI